MIIFQVDEMCLTKERFAYACLHGPETPLLPVSDVHSQVIHSTPLVLTDNSDEQLLHYTVVSIC